MVGRLTKGLLLIVVVRIIIANWFQIVMVKGIAAINPPKFSFGFNFGPVMIDWIQTNWAMINSTNFTDLPICSKSII